MENSAGNSDSPLSPWSEIFEMYKLPVPTVSSSVSLSLWGRHRASVICQPTKGAFKCYVMLFPWKFDPTPNPLVTLITLNRILP